MNLMIIIRKLTFVIMERGVIRAYSLLSQDKQHDCKIPHDAISNSIGTRFVSLHTKYILTSHNLLLLNLL